MSTPFTNIYSRAINEFNDPFITSTYGNTITFFQTMFGYLNNCIPEFIIPEIIIPKLQDITSPSGQTELFNGDGINTNFILTTIPVTGSYFVYTVSGVVVTGTYNSGTNSVILDIAPAIGTNNVSIQWYYPGQFNQTLISREERILSMLWVVNWAEKEKNHLLDIRRLLNDTDFRLTAEAPTMNAKGNWYITMREEATAAMKQYSWSLYQATLKAKYGLS